MSDNKTHMYQSLARSLEDHGVRTLFGLMGDANLFMVDAFVREIGGEFIPAAHEGSAVLMALAFAKVTGKVGIATITHGPALTNSVTALTEGARGQIPMVLMAGDTAVENRNHLQGIDQREVVKTTGAGFEQIRSPQSASQDFATACYRAMAERRPIVLNMPADFMWEPVDHQKIVHTVFNTPAYAPEGDMLDEAIGMIASAKRPLILAGGGAKHAKDQIVKLANRLEAPLGTSLKAKGLFSDHPYNIDICGTLSTPEAYNTIANADCIICFGTSLNDFTTDRGKLFKGKRVIQVDRYARSIGHFMHPDAALIADAGLTADNFVEWLDAAEIPASGFTNELDPETLTKHTPPREGKTAEGTIDYETAVEWFERNLPEDRVLVTDGGRFMTEVWCRVSVPDGNSFVDTVNFGSIGLGMQEAIGAAVAKRDRPTVLFTGDGGFMMGGINEFNTAVRLGLDLIIILCNDAAYGAEHIQFVDRQMDPALSMFDWPSFAEVANSLGGHGVDVRSEADLDDALAAINSRNRPLLIDLHLDPTKVPRMRI